MRSFQTEILESPCTSSDSHTHRDLVKRSKSLRPLCVQDTSHCPSEHPRECRGIPNCVGSGCWGLGACGKWELQGGARAAWGRVHPAGLCHHVKQGQHSPAAAAPGHRLGTCGGTHLLAEPQEPNGVRLSPEAAGAIHTAGPGRDHRGDGERRARTRGRGGWGTPSRTSRQARAQQGGVGTGREPRQL